MLLFSRSGALGLLVSPVAFFTGVPRSVGDLALAGGRRALSRGVEGCGEPADGALGCKGCFIAPHDGNG